MPISSDFSPLGISVTASESSTYNWIATEASNWRVAANWELVEGPGNTNGYPGLGDIAQFLQGSADCSYVNGQQCSGLVMNGWMGNLVGAWNTWFYVIDGVCDIRTNGLMRFPSTTSGAGAIWLENSEVLLGPGMDIGAATFAVIGNCTLELGSATVNGTHIRVRDNANLSITSSIESSILELGVTGYTTTGNLILDSNVIAFIGAGWGNNQVYSYGNISGTGMVRVGSASGSSKNTFQANVSCDTELFPASGSTWILVGSFSKLIHPTNRALNLILGNADTGVTIGDWEIPNSAYALTVTTVNDLEITGNVTASGTGAGTRTFIQDDGTILKFSGNSDQNIAFPFSVTSEPYTARIEKYDGGNITISGINFQTDGTGPRTELTIGVGATMTTYKSGYQGYRLVNNGTLNITAGDLNAYLACNGGTNGAPLSFGGIINIEEGALLRVSSPMAGEEKEQFTNAGEIYGSGTILYPADTPIINNNFIEDTINLVSFSASDVPSATLVGDPDPSDPETHVLAGDTIEVTLTDLANVDTTKTKWWISGELEQTGGTSFTLVPVSAGSLSISVELFSPTISNLSADRSIGYLINSQPRPQADLVITPTLSTVGTNVRFLLSSPSDVTDIGITEWELIDTGSETVIATGVGSFWEYTPSVAGAYEIRAKLFGLLDPTVTSILAGTFSVVTEAVQTRYNWIATGDTRTSWALAANWLLSEGAGNINGYPGLGDIAQFLQGSADCSYANNQQCSGIVMNGWMGQLSNALWRQRLYVIDGVCDIRTNRTMRFPPTGGATIYIELVNSELLLGPGMLIGGTQELAFDGDCLLELGTASMETDSIAVRDNANLSITASTDSAILTMPNQSLTIGNLIIDSNVIVNISGGYSNGRMFRYGNISGAGKVRVTTLAGGTNTFQANVSCDVELLPYASSTWILLGTFSKIIHPTNRTVNLILGDADTGVTIGDWEIPNSTYSLTVTTGNDLEITGNVTRGGTGSTIRSFIQNEGTQLIASGNDPQIIDWPFSSGELKLRALGGDKTFIRINAAINGFLNGGNLTFDTSNIRTRDTGIQGINQLTFGGNWDPSLRITSGHPLEANSIVNNASIYQEPNSTVTVGVVPEGSTSDIGTATNNGWWYTTWEGAPEGWEYGTSILQYDAAHPPIQNRAISSYITLEPYGEYPLPDGTLVGVPASGTSFVGTGTVQATVQDVENAVESLTKWFVNGTLHATGGFSKTIILNTVGTNTISGELYNNENLTRPVYIGPLSYTVTAYPLPSAVIVADKTSGTTEDTFNFSLGNSSQYTDVTDTVWSISVTDSEDPPTYLHTGATLIINAGDLTRGSYTIWAQLTGPGGTSDRSINITVATPAPSGTLYLDKTLIYLGETVTATILDGTNIDTISWLLNNVVQPGSGSSNVFTPISSGLYTVRAILSNIDGSITLDSSFTVIYPDPVIEDIDVSPISPYVGQSTTITVAVDDVDLVEKYILIPEYGAEEIESLTGVFTLSYSAAGTKLAMIQVAGISGNTVTQNESIVVRAIPDPVIDSATVIPTTAVTDELVTATVVAEDTSFVLNYGFIPGDDSAELTNNTGIFTYAYTTAGVYLAYLVIYGTNGSRILSSAITVTIDEPGPGPAPVVESIVWSPTSPISGDTVTITITVDDESLVETYVFDAGDGSGAVSSTSNIFTHIYTAPGTYEITAQAIGFDLQVGSSTADITIKYPVPSGILTLSASDITIGQTVTATLSSMSNVTAISWKLNDIDYPGTGDTNTFSPTDPGTYIVKAILSNPDGSITLSATFTADYADPEISDISIVPDAIYPADDITITIIAVDPTVVATYLLEDSVSGISLESDTGLFHITYPTAGIKSITISLLGINGNTVSQNTQITVLQIPNPVIATYSIAPTQLETGDSVAAVITAVDTRFVESYGFDPGDGTEEILNTTGSFSHTYTAAGTYNAYLQIYGVNGSVISSPIVPVIVTEPGPGPAPVIANIIVSPSAPIVNMPATITIIVDNASLVQSYVFNPGDGGAALTSDNNVFTYIYASADVYEAVIQVIGVNGSVISADISINVLSTDEYPPGWCEDDDCSRYLFDCDYLFDDIRTYPIIPKGTGVQWAFNTKDIPDDGPYLFTLQYGYAGVNDNDAWTDIVSAEYVSALEDKQFRVKGRLRYTHYRIKLETADRTYFSRPIPVTGRLKYTDWMEYKNILQAEYFLLASNTGTKGTLFKKKIYGKPCPRCKDFNTEQAMDSHCPVCLGTEWVGGYYIGSPCFYINTDPAPHTVRQSLEAQGTVLKGEFSGRAIASPIVESYDVWRNDLDGSLFTINECVNIVEMRKVPIVHMLGLDPVAMNSVLYEGLQYVEPLV